MNKGLAIHTNQAPVARQWPRLFEHIRAGHVSPRELIIHRIPLEHIAEGYHMVCCVGAGDGILPCPVASSM